MMKKDVLFITGDWNTKVGNQQISGITGKFGLGIQNEAGQRLTEFFQDTLVTAVRTEVCNTVQEAVTKTIPKKKKCKKAKWLSEEALQTAEEKREVESQGERERYTQLNAEFQRIAISSPSLLLNF